MTVIPEQVRFVLFWCIQHLRKKGRERMRVRFLAPESTYWTLETINKEIHLSE